jgi:membrane associated rhomboid family serine protease
MQFGWIGAWLFGPVYLPELYAESTFKLVVGASGAVYLALGVLFLIVGIRRAYRNPLHPFSPQTSHTVAVALVGASSLAFAVESAFEPKRTPDISAGAVAGFCLMGASAMAVVALRARRSPLARPATAALNIAWSIFVPFGTGLFLWWLISVRNREARERAP